MNEEHDSRGRQRVRPWTDLALVAVAAIFFADHPGLLLRILAVAVMVWCGTDLARLIFSYFRKAGKTMESTGYAADGEARPDIVLRPGDRGEWTVSPDIRTGEVEVELLIRGQRYMAILRDGESSAYDETVRRIADELDAGASEVNVNSTFLATLGREPFFTLK